MLIDLFSPWALALALLLVVAVRATLARPSRRPTAAELAVLFGFGIALCSLAQTPTPWSQAARLRAPAPLPALRPAAAEGFVRAHARPGEPVLIVLPLGHRIAYDAGVDDVFPYADLVAAVTLEQWDGVRRIALARHVRSAFVEAPFAGLVLPQLQRAGFRVGAVDAAAQLVQLTRPAG